MVGSAVVVMVLPFAGAVMVGAAGGGGHVDGEGVGGRGSRARAAGGGLRRGHRVAGIGQRRRRREAPAAARHRRRADDVPSIDTVTVSPLIPDPEMVGSAVVVMVLPLAGAVMVGAAGAEAR